MHICFLSSEFAFDENQSGGIGVFIRTLGQKLVKNNVKVSVVGIFDVNRSDTIYVDGINIHRIKKIKIKYISWIINKILIYFKLLEINSVSKINILESSEAGFAFLPKIKTVRYLIRLHGGHHFFAKSENKKINYWKSLLEKLSFKKADYFVAVSNYVLNSTRKFLDIEKATVIYNPINLKKFSRKKNSKKKSGQILFTGTVCEKKGVFQLIKAFEILLSKKPNLKLIIAGRDLINKKTGKSYINFLKSSFDSSLFDKICFLGYIPNSEIPQLISSSEICCLPSHMESFGIVWAEVMSIGTPLVASNTGPATEIITNEGGYLCDPKNPKNIAQNMLQALDDREVSEKKVKRAKELVKNRFDIEIVFKENINFYKSII